MFAFGTKRAPVGLEQEGFAGAVDIIKVINKEDFCTVSNCPLRLLFSFDFPSMAPTPPEVATSTALEDCDPSARTG